MSSMIPSTPVGPIDFRARRLRAALSQAEQAAEVGVSVDVVRGLEDGRRPYGENLRKVIDHYGLNPLVQWPQGGTS